MISILIHKKQITLVQNKFFTAVDNMLCLAFAHINHFDIIMAVPWKVYETCMRAYFNQPPFLEQLFAVNNKLFFGCI